MMIPKQYKKGSLMMVPKKSSTIMVLKIFLMMILKQFKKGST